MDGKSQEHQWAFLMRAANEGDAEAYRKLLLQLTPVLRAFAPWGVARAGMADAAEDIVQETCAGRKIQCGEDVKTGDLIRVLAADNDTRALAPGRALALALIPAVGIN